LAVVGNTPSSPSSFKLIVFRFVSEKRIPSSSGWHATRVAARLSFGKQASTVYNKATMLKRQVGEGFTKKERIKNTKLYSLQHGFLPPVSPAREE
jgi:hypothetical protein